MRLAPHVVTYAIGWVTGTGLFVLALRVWEFGPDGAGISGRRSGIVFWAVNGLSNVIGQAGAALVIAGLGLAILLYCLRLGQRQARDGAG